MRGGGKRTTFVIHFLTFLNVFLDVDQTGLANLHKDGQDQNHLDHSYED